MEFPAPAGRPQASRRRNNRGRVKSHGALVGTPITINVSEAISPSCFNHMPQSACGDGIPSGRGVQGRLVYADHIPKKNGANGAFERILKAQVAALQRKFDARLSACSTAAATASESPCASSDCGEEKRPLASEGGVKRELLPARSFPVNDNSIECALMAQAVALQRKFDAQVNVCSTAATTAPESPPASSDCGEEKRPLASEGEGVEEFVPAHCFPKEDYTFEMALKAQTVALQRTIQGHLDACSTAATKTPESPRLDYID